MSDLAFSSATELARLVRDKSVSPVELVDLYLDRIEKIDPSINAFVTLVEDRAREEARDAELRVMRAGDDELPPFLGVPTAIKDLNRTEGITTTFSSKAFANFVPEEDDSTVRRMRSAGMIVLGKTNTPEFGFLAVTESDLNGYCHNPWDTERTPGGSSGGAGAAVAAGMIPVAQGSDGGGSIRIPSSCCGLFGIKPARGRVSHAPGPGEAWSGFSTDGPIARTVKDAAALLDVMSGYETGDPYQAPTPSRPFEYEVGREPGALRIAFTAVAPTGATPDPEVASALQDAAALLDSLGHEVEESTPDWLDPEAAVLWLKQSWFVSDAYHDISDLGLLETHTRAFAEMGREMSAHEYVQTRAKGRRLAPADRRELERVRPGADPDIGPASRRGRLEHRAGRPVGDRARGGMFAPYTQLVNLTGQPAMSVPLFWSEAGLPIGVQLIARPAAEATLIRVAAQLEEARPWRDRHPAMSFLDYV